MLEPHVLPGFAPFRQQQEGQTFPWELTPGCILTEPLCFKLVQKIGYNFELCIRPIGHDDGEHEPKTDLAVIRGHPTLGLP